MTTFSYNADGMRKASSEFELAGYRGQYAKRFSSDWVTSVSPGDAGRVFQFFVPIVQGIGAQMETVMDQWFAFAAFTSGELDRVVDMYTSTEEENSARADASYHEDQSGYNSGGGI